MNWFEQLFMSSEKRARLEKEREQLEAIQWENNRIAFMASKRKIKERQEEELKRIRSMYSPRIKNDSITDDLLNPLNPLSPISPFSVWNTDHDDHKHDHHRSSDDDNHSSHSHHSSHDDSPSYDSGSSSDSSSYDSGSSDSGGGGD